MRGAGAGRRGRWDGRAAAWLYCLFAVQYCTAAVRCVSSMQEVATTRCVCEAGGRPAVWQLPACGGCSLHTHGTHSLAVLRQLRLQLVSKLRERHSCKCRSPLRTQRTHTLCLPPAACHARSCLRTPRLTCRPPTP